MVDWQKLRDEAEELTKGIKLDSGKLTDELGEIRVQISLSTNPLKRSALNVGKAIANAPEFLISTKSLGLIQISQIESHIKNMKTTLDNMQRKLNELRSLHKQNPT